MEQSLLLAWSANPAISLCIWAILVVPILYLGRKQAHQVFYTSSRALFRTMRLWSFSIGELEKRAAARNKEVLLAHGAKEAEKTIEREFTRISDIVKRDLAHYPTLHRQIVSVIERVEQDYQKSADTAPLPPAWKDVVETITAIPPSGDPAVNKILQNVKNAVEDSHNKTLKAYRQASSQRHKLLGAMHPDWRKMQATLDEVNHKVSSLDQRSEAIDEQMAQYRAICNGTDHAAHSLSASALTQFFISGLVLVIALLGGLINFQLIAMPMSEMVGGTSYIGDMKTSDIAALVIILIEIAMGLFLVESLRVTKLFPVVGSMDDKLRKRMMIISFSILLILACIEASLAYMRDLLALDREALNQALTGVGAQSSAVQTQFRWIPSIGQMIMGFILPFALAFIAIPLESFIHSIRIVLGYLVVGLLRGLRIFLRMLGGLVNHLGLILRHSYDLVIVVPLGLERLIKSRHSPRATAATEVDDRPARSPSTDTTNTGKASLKKSPPQTKLDDLDLAQTLS